MVFAYYQRLSRRQQATYRKSDGVSEIRLVDADLLRPIVGELATALQQKDRGRIQALCQRLAAGMTRSLGVPPVRVRVLAARPHNDYGELHGLYEPTAGDADARITVWMRTAQRHQVVAFRTFLRTVAHELCHHLDYEYLQLDESFHTAGFFQRESSLVHQIAPAGQRPRAGAAQS